MTYVNEPYLPWLVHFPMSVIPPYFPSGVPVYSRIPFTEQPIRFSPVNTYYPHRHSSESVPLQANGKRIRHLVFLSLKPELNAEQIKEFLQESVRMHLSIPAVAKFQLLCRSKPDQEYPYAFDVEFSDLAALEVFQIHPLHLKYVDELWKKRVDRYLISDWTPC